MARKTYVGRSVIAGCFICNGNEAIWHTANAQGVAPREQIEKHAAYHFFDVDNDQVADSRFVFWFDN